MSTRTAMQTAYISTRPTMPLSDKYNAATCRPLFDFGGQERTFNRNAQLFREGEPVNRVYKMVRGVVRSYKSLADGQRQIEAFEKLPGDIFGLELELEHEFCAEAVTDIAVHTLCTKSVTDRADVDINAALELRAILSSELYRVQQRALMLPKNAHQRVAGFLLEMSHRLGDNRVFALPMSRQDIADYLGLTIETVSRTFTQLHATGLVGLPTSRQILLKNVEGLRRMESMRHLN